MTVSWDKSKKKLATFWLLSSFIIFAILLAQTILGRYESNIDQVFGWFLPTIMPTLSLIIGVLVNDAFKKSKNEPTVDSFFFRLSYTLSLAYLITVLLTLLLQPFSAFSALELMRLSNLWLAPFQGLVSASLGVFFVSRHDLNSIPVS